MCCSSSRAAAEEILAKLQTAGGYTVERVPNESNIVLLKPSEARIKGLQERLIAADIRIATIRNGVTTFFINETVLHRTPDEIAREAQGEWLNEVGQKVGTQRRGHAEAQFAAKGDITGPRRVAG